MDEKTLHINASVVTIVTWQRRKAKEGTKKKKNTVRLGTDDVMTKTKMEGYQDSYVEAMAKYCLQRGIRGSDARHITSKEYYRNVFEKAETVNEEIGALQQQEKEQ